MARFTKPRIGVKLPPMLRRKATSKSVEDFGVAGKPVDFTHPFYFGFMVTVGALLALTTLRALASASAVFILIIVSFVTKEICMFSYLLSLSNMFPIKKWISLGIELKVEKNLLSNSLELLLLVFEQLHVDIELKQKSKSLTSSSFLDISSG